MAGRLSEVLAARIAAAIEELPILQAEKDAMEFELIPAMQQRGGGQAVGFMIFIGLPVGHGTGDWVMPAAICEEPHPSGEQLRMFVSQLADEALRWRDQAVAKVRSALNGEKVSPGGLIMPS